MSDTSKTAGRSPIDDIEINGPAPGVGAARPPPWSSIMPLHASGIASLHPPPPGLPARLSAREARAANWQESATATEI